LYDCNLAESVSSARAHGRQQSLQSRRRCSCAEGRKWVREPKFSDEVKPQEVDRFAQQFGY